MGRGVTNFKPMYGAMFPLWGMLEMEVGDFQLLKNHFVIFPCAHYAPDFRVLTGPQGRLKPRSLFPVGFKGFHFLTKLG